MAGALLDPKRNDDPVALTESEYRALKTHLGIMRSSEYAEHQSVLNAILWDFDHRLTRDNNPLLGYILHHFQSDNVIDSDSVGVLAGVYNKPMEELAEDEMEILHNTLKVVRNGGWFPDWLGVELSLMVDSDKPARKYPSPLAVAEDVLSATEQYDFDADAAREMVQMRPDLFAPPAAAPVEPPPSPKQDAPPKSGKGAKHAA